MMNVAHNDRKDPISARSLASDLHYFAATTDSQLYSEGIISPQTFRFRDNSKERESLNLAIRSGKYYPAEYRLLVDAFLNAACSGGDIGPGARVQRWCLDITWECLDVLVSKNSQRPLGEISGANYNVAGKPLQSNVVQLLQDRDSQLLLAIEKFSENEKKFSAVITACRDEIQLANILVPFEILRRAADLTRSIYDFTGHTISALRYPEILKRF